ncbi:hypothetical protein BV898_12152 [Hypsibius exemplaris]|uniref:Uncharacterized protein n=1 Tax=Hypsibius exemplaris TaxID=2072580 RepID=A0A1W0WEJ1_HYPEX|nr:hypothetical protein BV898_12152 [Hypsibius exemplaris]
MNFGFNIQKNSFCLLAHPWLYRDGSWFRPVKTLNGPLINRHGMGFHIVRLAPPTSLPMLSPNHLENVGNVAVRVHGFEPPCLTVPPSAVQWPGLLHAIYG